MADYFIAQNSGTPPLTATLTYADGTPVELGGATVNIVLRNPEATLVYLNQPCVITSSDTVQYQWQVSDTAVAGDYLVDFDVTYIDGSTQTFPNEGYNSLTITPSLVGSSKPRPSWYTTGDAIADVRGYLDGRTRPVRNYLAGDIDSVATSFALTQPLGGAVAGSQLTVGLETMYVISSQSNTLTVERGADGSAPSQHARGDLVLINPEFTDARIFRAINDELKSLPSEGVYAIKTLDVTEAAQFGGYNLAADVVDVLAVSWQHRGDATEWTTLQGWSVERDMPTATFPSGIALMVSVRPGYPSQWLYPSNNSVTTSLPVDTHALRVRYQADLGTLTTLFDDVLGVTGLPTSARDLPALGAAVRLMAGRPIQRVSSLGQPDPRNGLEVKAGDVLNAAAALRQQRTMRVGQEADKISKQFVWRKPARRLMGN